MRNRIIFTIFTIGLLAFVFYFCFADLIFVQKTDFISNVLRGEASQFISQEEKEIKPEKVETTLLAVGDIMLSRHVGTKIRQAEDSQLPFQKLKDKLNQADITFGNLESPFYDKGSPVTEGMIFKAEPDTVEGLVESGFDIVSLANNHFGNQGEKGMIYTFDHLQKNNVKFVGAGKDFEQAHDPMVLENKGVKFAFLAYSTPAVTPASYAAAASRPGLNMMDIEQLKQDVVQAKERAEIVIISMHAGTEYTNQPNQRQKDFAHTACDSGASLVLGHHPHVVQITEQYNNCYIIYSLGNFVFDQMWSEETREGIIAKCKFEDKELKEVEFIPIKIEDYNQPRLAYDSESKEILKRMNLDKTTFEFNQIVD